MNAPRYAQARERAGLGVGQAAQITGLAIRDIELNGCATEAEHNKLAQTYGVSPCWLAGHNPQPDLTDLAQQARDKGVSYHDWREIATFVQSMSSCARCAKPPSTPVGQVT